MIRKRHWLIIGHRWFLQTLTILLAASGAILLLISVNFVANQTEWNTKNPTNPIPSSLDVPVDIDDQDGQLWWQWLPSPSSSSSSSENSQEISNHNRNEEEIRRKFFTKFLIDKKIIIDDSDAQKSCYSNNPNLTLYPITIFMEDKEDNPLPLPMIDDRQSLIRFANNNRTTLRNNNNSCDILVVIESSLSYNNQDNQNIRKNFPETRIIQNGFPELIPIVQRPDLQCQLFDEVRKYPALRNNPITPLCFRLPGKLQQFLDVSDALGYGANWTLEYGPKEPPEARRITEPVRTFSPSDRSRLIRMNRLALRNFQSQSNLLLIRQHLTENVLKFHLEPIRIRTFALVTGVNPLRAWRYQKSLLYRYRQQEDSEKTPVPVEELWNELGPGDSGSVNRAIQKTLLYALLLFEISGRLLNQDTRNWTNRSGDKRTFQLISFDLVVCKQNGEFQAYIVQTMTMSQLAARENLTQEPQRSLIGDLQRDAFELILYRLEPETILEQFERRLGPLVATGDQIGLVGVNCHISHRICLTGDDLRYLSESLSENSAGNFIPIYPIFDEMMIDDDHQQLRALFEQILVHLDTSGHHQQNQVQNHRDYQTERLHPVVELMFSVTGGGTATATDHDLTNLNWTEPLFSPVTDGCDSTTPGGQVSLQIVYPEDMRLITIQSSGGGHRDYHVNRLARHQEMIITMDVSVTGCNHWFRYQERFYLQKGRMNFSLGLGDNHIRLTVVDRHPNHHDEQVVSIQTVNIRREDRPLGGNGTVFCYLRQDCDLRIYPTLPCGLTTDHDDEEPEKICPDAGSDGRWRVPCGHCDHPDTCQWKKLEWKPIGCRYRIPVDNDRLHQCLSDKNILMIGDSTNRGMMHYILERLNRTLTDADKTHDHKMYRIADGTTTMMFAYYPKFWLPPDRRPSFREVFRKSLETFDDQSRETIIVFGGVHWLARKHLQAAREETENKFPGKIRLVAKTLGAGFHQSVIGVHHVSLEDQIRLSERNRLLVEEARHLGIEPLDTFNMTVALYKDFYPGKCCCHFHRIIKTENGYHVDGHLNRIYSEILLSRLCYPKKI